MTEQEIHNICNEYDIDNYTINPDGSIDVDDNVNLIYMELTKIPIKFNKVSGYFDCYKNELISLEGCPKEVGGYFSCSNNKLSTLEGSPNYVGDSFYCSGNKLTTLEGCSKEVGGDFYCNHNQLTTLDGYNGDLNKLYCNNKKLVRKTKLKLIDQL